MTRFVLVRHGETDENAGWIFQGQAGGPLNARGQRQAQRLAERLARFRFDACYSSDLPRARQTAEILTRPLALQPLLSQRLREVFVGSWQGKTLAEVERELPEEAAAWARGEDIRRGGGESYQDVAERVAAGLHEIAEAFAEGTVLVVSHGAGLRAAIALLLGMPLHSLGGIKNTALSVLDYTLQADENAPEPAAPKAPRDYSPQPLHGHRLHLYNDLGHLLGTAADGDALASLDVLEPLMQR